MRNLIRFVLRYNFPILFLVFELIAIILIFSHNPIQRGKLTSQTNSFSTIVFDKASEVTQYIHLRRAIDQLAKENSLMRSRARAVRPDSIDSRGSYVFIPARVINNTVQFENNYLTLDIGTRSGVEPDMAVVSPFGIVGVVKTVSPNYCRVISVLNSQLRVSVRLSKSGYFGSLSWDRLNYRDVLVTEIPSHVSLEPGDSIVSSGYSSIFPSGEPIATVIEATPAAGGNFLEIRARLSTDFKKLYTVYVVKNTDIKEVKELEEYDNEK
ncbi:MAG: rod shape-determining protein MreC [Bacteroidales bacterium]|nr:rod shape-determining protein MreC [Bacteroidales bacterium]